jgi:ppGpp synthetase/RelA/SpoT-type nucleotidyltranferase
METNIILQNQKATNAIELSIIQNIHEIRGVRVMLDFDLAKRYGVGTGVLNQAVKRNIRRFPDDFMFQLTKDEWQNLKSQIVISSWGGTRKLPNAFTEQGVAMLSGLLNSDTAIDTNIKIMRAFVAIRQYLMNYAELKHELYDFKRETNIRLDENDTRLDNSDMKVDEVFKMLTELLEQKKAFENRTRIGFNAHKDND